MLDYKVGRATALVTAQPLDREAFNAALRGLFKSCTIDYKAGELRFEWIGGGETDVMFAWPEDESAIDAAASTHG